jgi:integrase
MMSRRGKGEGSIRQRKDGRWEATLTLPALAGRRQRKSYFGKTRVEVARKLTAALKARQDGLPIVGERLTVGQYLGQWLGAVRPTLRPESYRRYEEMCRLHIIPEIGRTPLARLAPGQLQRLYASKLEAGLSGTSVQLLHGVVHKALDQAARWGLAPRNVADLVTAPRRTTPEMRTLTPEEASRLLEAARGERLEAFFVLAITSGLRLGELQALRWKDCDLNAARLRVTATYQGNIDGQPVFAQPKTAKSRREIHLSALAIATLQQHRLAQLRDRYRAANLWEDHGLVFATLTGRPLDGNNVRQRAFRRLLERAGLPPMRFHSLRHTAATLLMAEGVPIKVASEMLGHADITTTLRTYSHVLPGMQQQAADAMDRLFAKG